jgi:hypothetical protein
MYKKSIAALMLTLLAATAAQAEPPVPKNLDKLVEARDKTAKIWSELFDGKDMKTAKNIDSLFGKIFGNAGKEDSGDDDDNDDGDSTASADEPCVSAADGKPGTNNSAPGTGNGGKGGTVIIDGKAASGGCYSANGGDGGSNNYSWGKNNVVGGNGGDGGKIISR